jgi:hypothetical protein
MTYPYDDAEDRLIARALDIDGTDDIEEIDEAAMDRATVDEYRRVLAYLSVDEIAPPAGLEDRVIDAALDQRPAAAHSIARPTRSRRRRSTARWVTLGAAVAAAAAVIAFMFATTGNESHTPGGRVNLASAGNAEVLPVLRTPGVRKAPLETNDGTHVGDAALAPDGRGVLYNLDVPTRSGDQLYVWLVTDAEVVPIGPLTMPKGSYALDVTGDVSAVKGVAISAERVGIKPDLNTKPTIVARATF